MDNSSSQPETTPSQPDKKTKSIIWWLLGIILFLATFIVITIIEEETRSIPESNSETSTPSSDIPDYYHDPYPTRIQDESPNIPSQQTDHSLWAVVIMAVSSLAIVAIITLGIVGIIAILFKQPDIFNALLNGISEFCKNIFKGIFWFFAGKN